MKKARIVDIGLDNISPQTGPNAPSIYAVFNLVHNGKLLADHYISDRRFQNILNKELGAGGGD